MLQFRSCKGSHASRPKRSSWRNSVDDLETSLSITRRIIWRDTAVGPWRRAPQRCMARMLRVNVFHRFAETVASNAPRVHQRCPCKHWAESHGSNLAQRAMAPPQICGAHGGGTCLRLEVPAEDCAAHQKVNDPRRMLCYLVVGRGACAAPFFFDCAGVQISCLTTPLFEVVC